MCFLARLRCSHLESRLGGPASFINENLVGPALRAVWSVEISLVFDAYFHAMRNSNEYG